MTRTQTVRWKITKKDGTAIAFTTIGFADTKAATDKWIGKGHRVTASWSWS